MSRHYLQSPYYFMCCSLYDANEDQPVPVPPATALAGTLVSSLHRLKDVDNNGKPAFFVKGGTASLLTRSAQTADSSYLGICPSKSKGSSD